MSIRRNPEPPDDYPELPEVEPMEPAGLPDLLREFCARHTDDPNVFHRPDDTAVSCSLGEQGCGPMFSLAVSARSVMFASGVDLAMTDLEQALVQELFDRLVDGVAFGSLIATPDGPQWGWSAPAMPYPYFHGIASHAIAYAGYLGDRVWPVVQQVATGELSVTDAVAILEQGSEQGRAESSSLEP
jgi:hypothetical protein